MSRALRLTLLVATPITLLVLLPIGVYGIDRAVSTGNVPRNVSVAGVEIGGTTPDEAEATIEAYEQELQSEPTAVMVGDTQFQLDPTSVALRADVETAVETALAQRSHSFFAGFFPWVASFSDDVALDLDWSLDQDALDAHLAQWEGEAIPNLAYEGAVAVVNGQIVVQYPTIGFAIDRNSAHNLIESELTTATRSTVELGVVESEPILTRADIDQTVETVRRMLSKPAMLIDLDRGVWFVLEPEQLGEVIRIAVAEDGNGTIELWLDQAVVTRYLEARRDVLEVAPVNVGFDIDPETNTVAIIPSQSGRVVDPEAATAALFEAASTGRSRPIPYMEGSNPVYTTEAAEQWGPLDLVSEFTTNMPGVERVHNIKLMADTIDGHVVWPGEVFSINEFVGRRTEAGGYLRDGAIIKGDVICCNQPANVGGGVSQYGTTFYNAVFFGCYEDVEHQPHSLYISRYPEGREATLGYPKPDVVFRNDSDAPVIIRNTYTDRTITVKFYGNNGGRICTAEKGERFNHTSARTVYEANPDVEPGTEVLVSKGSSGFSVTVTRVMTMPDGRVIREPFTHRYRGFLRKYEKHPCDLFADVDCPIDVPAVVGMTEGAARAILEGAGFPVAVNYVTDSENVGIVISASPGGKQKPGTPITITVGIDGGDD